MRRTVPLCLVVTVALLASCPPAMALPAGLPDPSFGSHGVAQLTLPGEDAAAGILLRDGSAFDILGHTFTSVSHQGKVFLARVSGTGAFAPAFGGLTPWDDAAPFAADALREPSGRIVVLVDGQPGNSYPSRIELLGFGASGRLDPSFGAGGVTELSAAGSGDQLLQAPDGTLLVAGEASVPVDQTVTGALLARTTPDGHELGSATIPLAGGALGLVAHAVRLGDGSIETIGAADASSGATGIVLTRFTAAGVPDTSFGAGGVVTLGQGLGPLAVQGATLDGSGRLIVSGARLGSLGRSVDIPVAPLLARINAGGTLDGGFAGGGRATTTGEPELASVVAAASGDIYAASPDGALTRFGAGGLPNLSFGVGGSSVAPVRFDNGSALLLSGSTALVGGALVPRGNAAAPLAVERVRLQGTGLLARRAGRRLQVLPRHGSITVSVPFGRLGQLLPGGSPQLPLPRSGAVLPELPPSASTNDAPPFAPATTVVDARTGTVRLIGAGGRADVMRARFALRSLRSRVAELALSTAGCSRAGTARLDLQGPFTVLARGATIRTASAHTTLTVKQGCGGGTRVRVQRGRVRISRTRRR